MSMGLRIVSGGLVDQLIEKQRGPDIEGYAAVYRTGAWRIVDRFSVVVPTALTWPTYQAALKHADKLNAAVIAGRFTS